jgi:hypothetical protein
LKLKESCAGLQNHWMTHAMMKLSQYMYFLQNAFLCL